MNVGFAGLGTMGAGMAQNLVKAGFSLKTYNRTPKQIEGATAVKTPKEAAADITFTCVSDDNALKEVLFGDNGVLAGAPKLLVDSGTTSVDFTKEIADECEKRNILFLDAPVTGGKVGAQEGTLLFMVGGDKKILDAHLKVFEAMGKKIVHCGPQTYGQRVKIALNLTQSMVLASYIEGVLLAVKNGVDLKVIREVLDNSGARNNAALLRMPLIESRDFTQQFKTALMHKDVKLAEKEMEKLGIDLPLSRAVIAIFAEAMERGFGEEDMAAIAKVLEGKAGTRIG